MEMKAHAADPSPLDLDQIAGSVPGSRASERPDRLELPRRSDGETILWPEQVEQRLAIEDSATERTTLRETRWEVLDRFVQGNQDEYLDSNPIFKALEAMCDGTWADVAFLYCERLARVTDIVGSVSVSPEWCNEVVRRLEPEYPPRGADPSLRPVVGRCAVGRTDPGQPRGRQDRARLVEMGRGRGIQPDEAVPGLGREATQADLEAGEGSLQPLGQLRTHEGDALRRGSLPLGGHRRQGLLHLRPQRAGRAHRGPARPGDGVVPRRDQRPLPDRAAPRHRQDRHPRRGAAQALVPDDRRVLPTSSSTPKLGPASSRT